MVLGICSVGEVLFIRCLPLPGRVVSDSSPAASQTWIGAPSSTCLLVKGNLLVNILREFIVIGICPETFPNNSYE